jgi:thiol-disulfide isomerase/thioredoxin
MLKDNILNVPLWVWIIIFIYITYNIYHSCKLAKEEFTNPKIKIYNFNTSWCGWSKRFQPEWDNFTEICKNMPDVEVYDIKCDKEENKEQCKKFNVPGYPSVIATIGNKTVNYNGERKSERLVEFIESLKK